MKERRRPFVHRFAVVPMALTPPVVEAEGRIIARTAAGGSIVPLKDVT
jgi:hypothetical protein